MTLHLLSAVNSLGSPGQLSILGYLDPGTGSYALQMLLASLFGGLFALKQSWAQCRGWLAQRRVGRAHEAHEA